MTDVFISYAKEDKSAAKDLAEAIARNGWSVWWDPEIPPGETWDDVIERQLTTAKCVVVLWSKRSIQKHWVRTEAERARERRVLVPVLIDNVRPPLAFERIYAAHLYDWKKQPQHEGFLHLMRAIARLAGTRAKRDPSVQHPVPPKPRAPNALGQSIKSLYAILRSRRTKVAGAIGIAAAVFASAAVIWVASPPPSKPLEPDAPSATVSEEGSQKRIHVISNKTFQIYAGDGEPIGRTYFDRTRIDINHDQLAKAYCLSDSSPGPFRLVQRSDGDYQCVK